MKSDRLDKQTRLEAFQTIAELYTYVFDVPAVLRGRKPLSSLVGLKELASLLGCVGMSILALDQYNLVLGRLASTIYLRDLAQFKRQTAQAAAWSVLYSIGIILSKAVYVRISALWRNALTRLVQRRYVRSTAYYLQRPGALGHNIPDPDQRILEDVQKVSQMMAVQFYKSISTTSNAIQAIVRLSVSVHPRYVLFSVGYLWATQKLRELMVPAMRLSRLNAATSRATGEYASAFRRLVSCCEPIVAHGGTAGEKQRILGAYKQVKDRQSDTLAATTVDTSWWYSAPLVTLEPLFMQLLVEVPFVLSSTGRVASSFSQSNAQHGMAVNAQVLGKMTLVKTLVDRMMKQVRVMMIMPRQLLGVAGTGARVVELLTVCQNLSDPDYQDSVQIKKSSSITLEGVTVSSPAGDVLVNDLTLEVKSGQNLLIVGPNGVGKTSIFRAMCGLWPREGSVALPCRQMRDVCGRPGIMFLPQVPYCPTGCTLNDILAYPHPVNSSAPSITKERMTSLLVAVDLEHLLEGDASGVSAEIPSWTDSNENLSLGELQRLALARLLYHRPLFAVLDECTSTFSEEFAERIYWSLASQDITIVTVSHRPKHKRFHQQQLSLTGGGHWSLAATDPGIQTPPATPPITPRAAMDPPISSPQACTENLARVDRGLGVWSSRNAVIPQATVVRRILMILRILASRRRSTTFLLSHISCIFLSVALQSRILAALPGQLQALAMQSNRAAYTQLSISAFLFRLLSAVSTFLSAWAGNKLSIEWESSLTQCIIDRVMGHDSLFYKLERVDKRIDDMETRIVADVNLLALAMQAIITSLLTPISSAVLATRLLVSANLPLVAISTIWGFCISGVLLQKFLAPDYAGFAALTSLKQGAFRRGHQRLIANAESVAMMCGEERELENLEELLDDVTRENQRQLYYTTRFNCVNYWFTQYLPILITNGMRMFWAMSYGSDHAIMSEANGTGISSQGLYIQNLITQSFTATVGLLSMNNSFQTLVGHIARVTDLLMVIDEIQSDDASTRIQSTDTIVVGDSGASVPGERGRKDILLMGVDIVAPDGTKLVGGLELELHAGDSLMVTGHGKSSLFRVLSKMWDARGVVHVPSDILRVPQSPLVTCTPVDLLTYLSYPLDIEKSEQTSAQIELQILLESLGVNYLIKREGWTVRRHWVDVLSLGELQCLAVTRALFQIGHKRSPRMKSSAQGSATPHYSWLLLDDCTSALSAEVEAQLYCQVEVTRNNSVHGHKVGLVSFGSEERESFAFYHDRLLRLGMATEQQPSGTSDRSEAGLCEHRNWQVEMLQCSHLQRSASSQTSSGQQQPPEFRLDEVHLPRQL